MVTLSPRLLAVAGYVTGGAVADVGCDHGQLGAYLLQQDRAQRVYAIDCSPDSLAKARRLAQELALTRRLWTLQGNGLQPLMGRAVDCVVLAGISGMQMAQLLRRDADLVAADTRLVLQPMQGRENVAAYLLANGYRIREEDLVREGGRLFDILVAQRGREQDYPPRYAPVGYRLLQKRHPLLPERTRRMCAHLRRVVAGLPPGERPALRERLEVFEAVEAMLRDAADNPPHR